MEDLSHAEEVVPSPEVQAIIDRLAQQGAMIEHFGTGRVDNFSDEGFGLVLVDAQTGDEDGDFVSPDRVTLSDRSALSVGSLFDYVAYTRQDAGVYYELLLAEPREFTDEENARIAVRAAELMKVLGKPPTGPIF